MKNTKMIGGFPFEQLEQERTDPDEMIRRSGAFYHSMNQRRSVRDFSDKPVPKEVIENLLLTACSAPSGAHKQPWFFCAIEDATIKKKIRIAAEAVEYESYHGGMPQEWLEAIKPIQTNWEKPFLETAPILIAVFKKAYDMNEDEKAVNYYVNESVGLACGFLLAAIHQAGLVALTHTPSPMDFLTKLLERPKNERPFLLIPVGYPADHALVPVLKRKEPTEVYKFY